MSGTSNDIRAYLNLLFGSKAAEHFILIWRLTDKKSFWFPGLQQAAAFCEANATASIYSGVATSPEDFGPAHRCPANRVASISGLWSDLDCRDPRVHQKHNLPPTEAAALSVLPPDFEPSMVVHSGHGLQTFWLFREPEIFSTDEERDKMQLLARQWHRLIEWRARAQGYVIDATWDLARLLRVPGTLNTKDPDNPIMARIIALSERRYNPSDFADAIAECPSLARDPQAEAEALLRSTDARHKVNLDGVILSEDRTFDRQRLDRCMQDELFRRTWTRGREFNDQSQSSYDLALANWGVDAGMSEQDIVDLLITHRRQSGSAKPKLRLDYYRRTLNKARDREGPSGNARSINISAATADEEPEPEGGDEPRLAAVAATKQLGALLGVDIVRVVQITGDQDAWRFELPNGKTASVNSSVALIKPDSLISAMLSRGYSIPDFTRKQWAPVRHLISAARICVYGGAEADYQQNCRNLLDKYLAEVGVCASAEHAFGDRRTVYLPFATGENGRIAIDSTNFRSWLQRSEGESSKVSQWLADIQARPQVFEIPNRAPQERWVLPSTFNANAYQRAEGGARIARVK